MAQATWIAAGVLEGRFLLWLMDPDGRVRERKTAERQSPANGTANLSSDVISPDLMNLIAPWAAEQQQTHVVLAGAVSAARDLRPVPCRPLDGECLAVALQDHRVAAYRVPGLYQDRPAGVLHGAETLVAGFLRTHPGFDGIICLPDMQTSWVHVSADEIVSFRNFATPQMLRSMARGQAGQPPRRAFWNDEGFEVAITECLSQPELLMRRICEVQAEIDLGKSSIEQAYGAFLGALIGAELAATRAYWLGQPVVLIGKTPWVDAYAAALSLQGTVPGVVDSDTMMLSGLTEAHGLIASTPGI